MGHPLPWSEQKKRYEAREPISWEATAIGQEFEPFEFSVTPGIVKDIIEVTGDEVDYRNMEAPQAIAIICGRLSQLGEKYRPAPGGTLTGLSMSFLSPAKIGDTITTRATMVSREERKGRQVSTLRAHSKNQNGDLLFVVEMSGMSARKEA